MQCISAQDILLPATSFLSSHRIAVSFFVVPVCHVLTWERHQTPLPNCVGCDENAAPNGISSSGCSSNICSSQSSSHPTRLTIRRISSTSNTNTNNPQADPHFHHRSPSSLLIHPIYCDVSHCPPHRPRLVHDLRLYHP